MYLTRLDSPVGELLLAAGDDALRGLWLAGQKHYAPGTEGGEIRDDLPVFAQAKEWLDAYFGGKRPNPGLLSLAPRGTPYQQEIWALLREIPYGEVTTYGALAKRYEEKTGRKTSARAVGSAVGRNPISIIVPCHRVVGVDGSLTGFAAGLERKTFLLKLEQGKTIPCCL